MDLVSIEATPMLYRLCPQIKRLWRDSRRKNGVESGEGPSVHQPKIQYSTINRSYGMRMLQSSDVGNCLRQQVHVSHEGIRASSMWSSIVKIGWLLKAGVVPTVVDRLYCR